jgi:hypothetical protein
MCSGRGLRSRSWCGTLLEPGYLPSPLFQIDEHSYHAAPLLHPVLPVWLEVHWALFPPECGGGAQWRLLVPSSRLFESWHLFRNLLEPGRPSLKLAALPWKIAFQSSEPRRYRLGYHLERWGRLARRIGGRLVVPHPAPGRGARAGS